MRSYNSSFTQFFIKNRLFGCASRTAYDDIVYEGTTSSVFSYHGATLHYLDMENQVLTTYRSLLEIHSPNEYSGRKEIHPLKEMLISQETGEFIHPDEPERLKSIQTDRERREANTFSDWLNRSSPVRTTQYAYSQPPQPQYEPKKYICVFCGELTSDHWHTLMVDGVKMCKCHACLDKGLSVYP